VPIRAGDTCFHCRRTIVDTTLAAELISEEGHAFKFSSVGCLTEYLRDHPNEAVKATFVTDHARGRLVRAEKASFVKFTVDPKLGMVDFAAFASNEAARAFGSRHGTTPLDWSDVRAADIEHAH
jgi:hypothetical protein